MIRHEQLRWMVLPGRPLHLALGLTQLEQQLRLGHRAVLSRKADATLPDHVLD